MRAVVIARPGGPEVLELREIPDPVPGPDELLVRVRASALNRADLLQRRGLYPAPPDSPADVPGLEFAGEVLEAGTRARDFGPGDRVMGILGGGGHAERVAVDHRLCMRIPRALDWVRAAAIPEAFLTAFDAMFVRGGLVSGEACLVQAAASGIGTAALQLAPVTGARAIGLCRTATKRALLADAGHADLFDPAGAEIAEEILRATGGDGVSLILDLVGGSVWSLYARVLRDQGRIVVLGLLAGSRAEIDLSFLMRRRVAVIGSVLRSRPIEEKIGLTKEFVRRVLPLFGAGRLTARVDRAFDLRRVAEAHTVMERNENVGKIVLTLGAD